MIRLLLTFLLAISLFAQLPKPGGSSSGGVTTSNTGVNLFALTDTFTFGADSLRYASNISGTYINGGVDTKGLRGSNLQSVIDSSSTGPIGTHYGIAVNAENDGSGTIDSLIGAYVQANNFGSAAALAVTGLQVYAETDSATTDFYGISVITNRLGATTNHYGLNISDVSGATNNYAIKTGLGKVDVGDIVAPGRTAGNPVACASSIYGYMYFNTTDKRLCVCIADGTDDAWVKSNDYSHATGHCTP